MDNLKELKRESLTARRASKAVDLKKVYEMIDSGMTVRAVAAELGVSTTTIYRRYYETQKAIKELEEKSEVEQLEEEASDFFKGKL